jgi:hypothetical protein
VRLSTARGTIEIFGDSGTAASFVASLQGTAMGQHGHILLSSDPAIPAHTDTGFDPLVPLADNPSPAGLTAAIDDTGAASGSADPWAAPDFLVSADPFAAPADTAALPRDSGKVDFEEPNTSGNLQPAAEGAPVAATVTVGDDPALTARP